MKENVTVSALVERARPNALSESLKVIREITLRVWPTIAIVVA